MAAALSTAAETLTPFFVWVVACFLISSEFNGCGLYVAQPHDIAPERTQTVADRRIPGKVNVRLLFSKMFTLIGQNDLNADLSTCQVFFPGTD